MKKYLSRKINYSKLGSKIIKALYGTKLELLNPDLSVKNDATTVAKPQVAGPTKLTIIKFPKPIFTEKNLRRYYEQNKNRQYNQNDRYGAGSDCSSFATGYWNSAGFNYLNDGFTTCSSIRRSPSFTDVDMYLGGNNLKVGDALLYSGNGEDHVVIYGGKDRNGNHYGYESAVNKFQRNGVTRNGVLLLTGLLFPKAGEVSYYGSGTWREGQTLKDARKDHAKLRLIGIRRPIIK